LTLLVEGAPPAFSGRNLAGFAYLSMIGTALAFIVWFNGIRRLSPAAPPLLGLAAPITGAALGWAILGQALSPQQLIGFAIAIAAIAYGASLRPNTTLHESRNATTIEIVATGYAARRTPWPLPFVTGSTPSARGVGRHRSGSVGSPATRTSRSRGSPSACS
jgi:probable blue pigment (indigoidine) exporter